MVGLEYIEHFIADPFANRDPLELQPVDPETVELIRARTSLVASRGLTVDGGIMSDIQLPRDRGFITVFRADPQQKFDLDGSEIDTIITLTLRQPEDGDTDTNTSFTIIRTPDGLAIRKMIKKIIPPLDLESRTVSRDEMIEHIEYILKQIDLIKLATARNREISVDYVSQAEANRLLKLLPSRKRLLTSSIISTIRSAILRETV